MNRRFVNGSIRRPKTAERASNANDTGKLMSAAAQQQPPIVAHAKYLAWSMTSGLPSTIGKLNATHRQCTDSGVICRQ
jgi:hypothetical protein